MSPRIVISAGIVALLAGILAAPSAQAAPSPVVPVTVPGSITPVWGSINGLPPMTQAPDSDYEAGPGFAPDIEVYRDTGQYQADQAAVAAAAQQFVRRWVRMNCTSVRKCDGRRAAMVFDIDDTLLDWYPIFQSIEFTHDTTVLGNASVNCLTPAIAPTAAVLRWAERRGIAVFLITGRNILDKASTESCLNQRGISGWAGITMRTATDELLAASVYKSRARAAIEAEGYRVIASIGDQLSDMMYGHAVMGFRLPNPMYYIA